METCPRCGAPAIVATITDSLIGTYQQFICLACGLGVPADRWATIQEYQERLAMAESHERPDLIANGIRSIFEGWSVEAQLSPTVSAEARAIVEELITIAGGS